MAADYQSAMAGDEAAAALRRAAQQDHARAIKEGRANERSERGADAVRVSINAPHRAQVRGNSIALTIRKTEEQQGAQSGAGTTPDFSLTASAGNVTIRDGTVNGEHPDVLTKAVSSSGDMWLEVALTVSTNVVASATLEIGTAGSMPADSYSAGTLTCYKFLGSYTVTAGAASITAGAWGIGSQTVSACRDWFSSPPDYTADWN